MSEQNGGNGSFKPQPLPAQARLDNIAILQDWEASLSSQGYCVMVLLAVKPQANLGPGELPYAICIDRHLSKDDVLKLLHEAVNQFTTDNIRVNDPDEKPGS